MLDPVTTRYAEALFDLAKKGGVLDTVRGDVERLSGELASRSVSAFFFDARVSMETRREKMQPLLSGMHRLTRDFVALLFDKRREEVLRGLGLPRLGGRRRGNQRVADHADAVGVGQRERPALLPCLADPLEAGHLAVAVQHVRAGEVSR